jgi:hypothetical protein
MSQSRDASSVIQHYNKELSRFYRLLRGENKDEIRAKWTSSPNLRKLFCGGTLKIQVECEVQISLTTFSQWYDKLFEVSALQLDYIFEAMFAHNREFASWFYGSLALEVGRYEKEVREALHPELLRHFDLVLKCGSAKTLKWFWEGNDNLQKALTNLPEKKQATYIRIAGEAGYDLQFLKSEQVVLTPHVKPQAASLPASQEKTKKRSKADSSPEEQDRPKKRPRLSLELSQPSQGSAPKTPEPSQQAAPLSLEDDKIRRYFTRAGARSSFFIPAPLREKSPSSLEAHLLQVKKL